MSGGGKKGAGGHAPAGHGGGGHGAGHGAAHAPAAHGGGHGGGAHAHGGGHGASAKKSGTSAKMALSLAVAVLLLGWFYWPELSTALSKGRGSRGSSGSMHRTSPAPAPRPGAPSEGPTEAKSGMRIPDMPRVVSNFLEGIPEDIFGFGPKKGAKRSSLPMPPEGTVKVYRRPGEVAWAGIIGNGKVSPWFEAMEDIYLFVDTGKAGTQTLEQYPGNPYVWRVVELSGARAIYARTFGEYPR